MSQQRPLDEERVQKIQELLGFKAQPAPQNTDVADVKTPLPSADVPVEPAPAPLPASDSAKEKSAFNIRLKPEPEKLWRALWTMASTISMVVNVILIIIVALFLKYVPVKELVSFGQQKIETLPPEIGVNTPLDLLQGLYDNFEKMDDAHIRTEILVEDEIPVAFTLGLNQTTTVVLSENVTIPGARVALTTGGLNIFNAPATVTLPAGTELPIRLSLNVPVDEMIPIELHVPVDIALNETDLHEPFVGLQDVVQPLYCLVKSDATNGKGELICLQAPAE
jgi:hypothetical protein